jgi:hypothetical protein
VKQIDACVFRHLRVGARRDERPNQIGISERHRLRESGGRLRAILEQKFDVLQIAAQRSAFESLGNIDVGVAFQ